MFLTFLFAVIMPQVASASTIASTTITADTEWTTAGSPYLITSQIYVTPNTTLTIDPGVVVKIAPAPQGNSLFHINGRLVVGNPSSSAEVVFTSIADDTYGGDSNNDGASTTPEENLWTAIDIGGDATATSTISHARFRYGGWSPGIATNPYESSALITVNSPLIVSDSTFESVPRYDFYLGPTSLDLERCVFEGQNSIVRVWAYYIVDLPAALTIHDSSMRNVRVTPINLIQGLLTAHLENNWWGAAAGPYDAVSNPTGTVSVPSPIPPTFIPFNTCDLIANPSCADTGPKVSSVLFLPGIEGSRLYEDLPCASGVCETKLWEPNGDTLALRLAHNTDGASVSAGIYEKKNDIIDNAYFPVKGNIYKSFIEQMDELVTAKTIKEWEAIPYDWRLSPEQILTSGAQIAPNKISYLVATSSPFIIQELKRLASNSKTKKVTIIAHSNGGLVTKALIEKLGPEAANLVDKIIFVAVPQAGTPQAIGALLHGYGQGLPVELFPYALSDGAARALATNMPMTYNLLPSATYFTQVDTPVVTFANQPFLAAFRNRYGDIIHSQERLHSFLVDTWRLASSTTEGLNYPSVGNEPLLTQAETLHANLDSWTPPFGITLYEIAGWGEKTLAGIDYYQGVSVHCDQILGIFLRCASAPKIDYHPRIVLDGDGTVVTPSALWTPGANRYWVNLKTYAEDNRLTAPLGRQHGDILEVGELRTFIQNLLTNNASATLPQYISTTAPLNQGTSTELQFTLHSPLTLNLYDDQGRHTGVSTTTGELEEGIPGSRYMKFGEMQFISAPSSIPTHLIMNGSAEGSFTLDAEEVSGSTIVASTTFAGIPSAATAVVKMDVPAGGLANMGALIVDESGNGHPDVTLQPKVGNTVLFDVTPPEIQVTFSTSTKSISFIGTDDSGTTTMTTSTVYPTYKKNQKEKERENHGAGITTVTVSDVTGNTAALIYTKTSSDSRERRDAITLVSVSYNGVKSDLSKTTLRYEWDMDKKGRYTVFAAHLRTASSTVEAQYQSKKNLTVITTSLKRLGDHEDEDRDDDVIDPRSVQIKLPGLVIPRIQMENGSAKIIY